MTRLGFSSWFEACTLILGMLCGRLLFVEHNFELAFYVCLFWFILFLIESKLQQMEEEAWKRKVFS